tara:strand:- start:944 stop:1162 length:219 start_codon:yes stop_codon:yes gene_type:complete
MDITRQSTDQTKPQEEQTQPQQEQRLVDVPVENEVMALNVIVSFIAQAQKRGAFSLEESSKIWECVKWFQKK